MEKSELALYFISQLHYFHYNINMYKVSDFPSSSHVMRFRSRLPQKTSSGENKKVKM